MIANYSFRKFKTFGSNIPFGGVAFSLRNYEYALLLKSVRNMRQRKEWKDKAKSFKEGKVCFCCGSKNSLAVHHESNKDYELLLDESCIVLCKGCHYLRHRGMTLNLIKDYYKKHPR